MNLGSFKTLIYQALLLDDTYDVYRFSRQTILSVDLLIPVLIVFYKVYKLLEMKWKTVIRCKYRTQKRPARELSFHIKYYKSSSTKASVSLRRF